MTDNTSDASATQTGLSPTVEPASSLAGSAASIPSADELLARHLLAAEYEDPRAGREGPYPTYAGLARTGNGAFTLCSIHAVMRGIEHGRAQAIEARRAETGTGSVHESAVPTGCAHTQPESH